MTMTTTGALCRICQYLHSCVITVSVRLKPLQHSAGRPAPTFHPEDGSAATDWAAAQQLQ